MTDSAATVFALAKRLRELPDYDDVARLHASVIEAIRNFEATARGRSVAHETVIAARYALCALLDETVLSTPWGSDSLWTKESLLGTFHGETLGGEQYFQILHNTSQDPARNLDLLELLYVCLCLGFQGKYAALDRGAAQLAEIQQSLYRTITNQRGEHERELSPQWQGAGDRRPAVARFIPLWVVPVATCAILALVFMGFSLTLNRSSDAVFAGLNALGKEIPVFQKPEPERVFDDPIPESRSRQRFAELLAEEVRRGLVDVLDLGNSTKIIVHNKGLFASGQSKVTKGYFGLIDKISGALESEPGPILITGHTDNQPIRTLRYPSNWHLSQARADSVVARLAEAMGEAGRLIAEGRADTEAIAPNDTAEGRQQNRRIEINIPKR